MKKRSIIKALIMLLGTPTVLSSLTTAAVSSSTPLDLGGVRHPDAYHFQLLDTVAIREFVMSLTMNGKGE